VKINKGVYVEIKENEKIKDGERSVEERNTIQRNQENLEQLEGSYLKFGKKNLSIHSAFPPSARLAKWVRAIK
jgi:hypothetical protein